MSKCTVCLDFDTQMSPIEPCENSGWPELDNLCPDHYREYLIQPAINHAYDSNVFVAELQQKLYNVEVAQGLRPCAAGPVKSSCINSNAKWCNGFVDDSGGGYFCDKCSFYWNENFEGEPICCPIHGAYHHVRKASVVDGRDSCALNPTKTRGAPQRVRPSFSNEVNDLEEME